MIRVNLREFHKSVCKELIATKNRVRNLIGTHNWRDEGHYKETILINVIKMGLPKNYSIGTGHIIKKVKNASDYEVSSQIDIIIYDNALLLLFCEGSFVITTPAAVRAIIEVKTNIIFVNLRCDNALYQKVPHLQKSPATKVKMTLMIATIPDL